MTSKKTLDIQHNNKLAEFEERQKEIQRVTQRLQELQKTLKDHEITKNECNDETILTSIIENIVSVQNDINETKNKLQELTSKNDELDYFVNMGPILFKYYDIVENGHDDTAIQSTEDTNNSILKYFMGGSKKNETTETVNKKTSRVKEDRGSLLDSYLSYTNKDFIKPVESERVNTCDACGSSNINVLTNDGIVHCTNCSCVEHILVDHDRPSYKDPMREISYFAYKRINHLNEWLSQIQGKETTEIPEEIYDQILMEIKKQQITNMADIKTSKIREILKKLKLNKYYEHCHHIKHRINGVPVPHLEPELEEKLRTMFKLIQTPFLKHMPSTRKNFLSYSYVLHKCIQLLGRDEYLPNFPLLKSREKLHQQDLIWKNICNELGWEFIVST